MEELRASDLRRDGWLARALSLDRDLTAMMKIGFSLSSRESGASDSYPTAMDDRGRTPRSRRDRAAIEAKMARDRSGIVSHRSASDRRSSSSMIDARSRPNRGAIVAKIVEKILAHVKRNWSRNQADSSRN